MRFTRPIVLVLVLAGVFALAVAIYDGRERAQGRVETLEALAAAQRRNCDGLNELRAQVRGVLVRSQVRSAQEGTLTETARRFYAASIRDLADVDCQARSPQPGG